MWMELSRGGPQFKMRGCSKVSQVMIINNSIPDIGLYTRPATLGKEYSLVEQFIGYYCHAFSQNNKKTRLAVFVEPRIDSGFPDVVFASYLPSISGNWSDKRELLDVFDLKLLSYLCTSKTILGDQLEIIAFTRIQACYSNRRTGCCNGGTIVKPCSTGRYFVLQRISRYTGLG